VALKAGIRGLRMLMAAGGVSLLLATTGCGAFFQCEGKTDCGTSSTSTGTGDYVYVSNSTSGSEYINGYTVGTGTLTAISGSPFSLGYVPVAMKVSPNNNFLYVAAAPGTAETGLWVYGISSTGVVTGGTQLTSTLIGAMDISPDGNFLFTIDSATGAVLTEYTLNKSTGAYNGTLTLSAPGGSPLLYCGVTTATPASQSCSVAVSPSEDFVGVSLGTTGTVIYPYTSTGGATNYTGTIAPGASSGDYSLAFDTSGFTYIARTTTLSPYGSLAATSPVQGTPYTYTASGATPRSVTLSTSYNYLYTANEGTNTISAFSVSSGALTQLAGSPQLGPTNVAALGVDRSGTYLLAAGYNSTNGLQMFTIETTGITAVTSVGTGATTTIPVVMALTH